jgi:hypothetical protein
MLDETSYKKLQDTLNALGLDLLFDPSIPALAVVPESSPRMKAERVYALGEKLVGYARRLAASGAVESAGDGKRPARPATAAQAASRAARIPAPEPEPTPESEPEAEPEDEPMVPEDPQTEVEWPDEGDFIEVGEPSKEARGRADRSADTREVVIAEDGFPHDRAHPEAPPDPRSRMRAEGRQYLDARQSRVARVQPQAPKTFGTNVVGAPTRMPDPLQSKDPSSDDSRKPIERFPPGARARPINPATLPPLLPKR